MTASVSTDCYFPGQVTPFAAVTDLHDVVGSVDGWMQAALGDGSGGGMPRQRDLRLGRGCSAVSKGGGRPEARI